MSAAMYRLTAGGEIVGAVAPAIGEARGVRTEADACAIMGDGVARPRLSKIPHEKAPTEYRYFVTLKRMDTGEEYLHPTPLAQLENWQTHFLQESTLMRGLDLTRDPRFPLLVPPGDATVALRTEFTKLGRRYRVTVTRAPPGGVEPGSNCVTVFAYPPDLPRTADAYDELCGSTEARGRCLLQSALVALGAQSGFAVDAEKEGARDVAEAMDELQLRHGQRAARTMAHSLFGTTLSGRFVMYDAEATAASATLPHVLRQLGFLRLGLRGPVEYIVYSVSKYAYVVHLPNVAGWAVVYQVNTGAPGAALQQLVGHTPGGVHGVGATHARAAGGSVHALQSLLHSVGGAIGRLRTGGGKPPNATTEYAGRLQYFGLIDVRRTLLEEATTSKRAHEVEKGKVAVRALQQRRGEAAEREAVVGSLFQLCHGLAAAVWKTSHNDRGRFLRALRKSNTPPPPVMRAAVEAGLKACGGGSHPSTWWEPMASGMDVTDPGVLCQIALHHGQHLGAFAPEWLLGGRTWASTVDAAGVHDAEEGRNYLRILIEGGGWGGAGSGLAAADVERIALIKAAAYAMLVGAGDELGAHAPAAEAEGEESDDSAGSSGGGPGG